MIYCQYLDLLGGRFLDLLHAPKEMPRFIQSIQYVDFFGDRERNLPLPPGSVLLPIDSVRLAVLHTQWNRIPLVYHVK